MNSASIEIGSLLIAWSIRGSMLLLVVTLFSRLWFPAIATSPTVKILWTLSYFLFLLHVVASFHWVHHWSHVEAYQATAEQTRELLGVAFGGGVYFNYLLVVAWAFLVWSAWFPGKRDHPVASVLQKICWLYLIFIAFNGVIVFKSGWLRAIGIGTIGLFVLAAKLKPRTEKNQLRTKGNGFRPKSE